MRIEKCYFCSANCYPGHGMAFARNDAKVSLYSWKIINVFYRYSDFARPNAISYLKQKRTLES